jgi:hypothetical protein
LVRGVIAVPAGGIGSVGDARPSVVNERGSAIDISAVFTVAFFRVGRFGAEGSLPGEYRGKQTVLRLRGSIPARTDRFDMQLRDVVASDEHSCPERFWR